MTNQPTLEATDPTFDRPGRWLFAPDGEPAGDANVPDSLPAIVEYLRSFGAIVSIDGLRRIRYDVTEDGEREVGTIYEVDGDTT